VILCGEEVTSFLTPWSPRFRYVVTRTFYLPCGGLNPELREGSERFFLNMAAHNGRFAEAAYRARLVLGHQRPIPAAVLAGSVKFRLPPIADLHRLADVPELLDRYHVEYIITSPPLWLEDPDRDSLAATLLAQRDELFRELGFEEVHAGHEHSLWRRSASAATGTRPSRTLPYKLPARGDARRRFSPSSSP